MHYANLVIISNDHDVPLEERVSAVMGPDEEHGGFWDWYQIGGRWTGLFDNYDPNTDPANLEVCSLCKGTGKRTDMEVTDGCNGCHGKGNRIKWPTTWGLRKEDVLPVSLLTPEHYEKFYRVVLPDGYGSYPTERYTPWREKKFEKQEMPSLEWLKEKFPDCLAVIVDNHN